MADTYDPDVRINTQPPRIYSVNLLTNSENKNVVRMGKENFGSKMNVLHGSPTFHGQ